MDKTEDLSLGYSFSKSSEKFFQGVKGEARIYRSFCNQDQVVGTSEDFCWCSLMVHWLKDRALSLQQLGLLL